MSTFRCHYCGEVVDPVHDRSVWHMIYGWAHQGQAGGSDVACRTPSRKPHYACDVCVRTEQARRAGRITPAQGRLV